MEAMAALYLLLSEGSYRLAFWVSSHAHNHEDQQLGWNLIRVPTAAFASILLHAFIPSISIHSTCFHDWLSNWLLAMLFCNKLHISLQR